jgi:hypothetical protein
VEIGKIIGAINLLLDITDTKRAKIGLNCMGLPCKINSSVVSEFVSHLLCQLDNAVRVTPFIVVPADELEKVLV